MLALCCTSFVISPNTAMAFKIPVVRSTRKVQYNNVTGRDIVFEGLSKMLLGLFFGIHHSSHSEDLAFEVMKVSNDNYCLILAWHPGKHEACGTATSHLHFLHCGSHCYTHDNIRPENCIMYDISVALRKDAINIGSFIQSTPSMLELLPEQYHKLILSSDPEYVKLLSVYRGCDRRIELITSEDKL
jgi:hypothetical protein